MLVGGVARGLRLRGRRHAPFGVAQDLLGRGAAVAVPGLLPRLFLGQRHGPACYMIFGNLGRHIRGYPGGPIANRAGNAAGTPRSASSRP